MAELTGATRVLLDVLDALPDTAWCEGICDSTGPITLGVPVGDSYETRALDPELAPWLVLHAESAPFGTRTGTHYNANVRDTRRLSSRERTQLSGFDLGPILVEIEQALGSDCRLAAELLDVLLYTPRSMFLPHKDTPRHDDQLGTLIVELPHTHRGGTLRLEDGDRSTVIDWSGNADPRVLRWVALFGDVDHEITQVVEGTRLAAVYTLRYRTDERVASPHRERVDEVIDAMIALYDDLPGGDELAIPCCRMIVAPREATQPLPNTVLRGVDRVVAAAFERAGMTVRVRECVVAADDEETPIVEAIEDAARSNTAVVLDRSIPETVIRDADAISWDSDPSSDYGHRIAAIAPYISRDGFPNATWLVRARARIPGEDMSFSRSGYFGNEYSLRHVYRFATMLVTVSAEWERT